MFKDKGYRDTFLEKERIKVRDLNRDGLLTEGTNNKRSNEDMGTSIVLDYNLQNRDVEKIIKKYWNVLKQDIHLKDHLSDTPRIIYFYF